MKICKLALTAVAGLGLMTASAAAAPITIDTFDGDAWVADAPFFIIGSEAEVAAGSAIGGWRDLLAESDSTDPLATEVRTSGGSLAYSNTAGSSGTGTVTWDGNDGDASTVDTSGLGGIDLTDGGTNDGFLIKLLSADANLSITLNVWDMAGNLSSLDVLFTTSLVEYSAFLYLDGFVGGADLTNVGAIQLVLDGPENIDAVIDFIAVAPVPLGPAMPPLLGALFMLGYLKRRQSRA